MAALDFPASSASPWTAPNGVIYTWNTDGYWEAKADPNDFDTDYLKLDASNDPVTGDLALDQDLDVGDNLAVTGTSAFTGNVSAAANLAVTGTSTFTGLTTHKTGVKVTGGDMGTIGKGLVSTATRFRIHSDRAVDVNSTILSAYHSGNVGGGLTVNSTFDFSSTLINANLIGVQNLELLNATENDTLSIFSSSTSNTNSPSSSVGTCNSFVASASTTYGSKLNIGFRGNLNRDGDKNYNFYAEGTAPNFFKGVITTESALQVYPDGEAGSNLGDDTNDASGMTVGSYFTAKRTSTGVNAIAGLIIKKTLGSNPSNNVQRICTFRATDGTNTLDASIRTDGSGGIELADISDYRTKENIVDLPSAVDEIKSLRPVNYNYIWAPGRTRPGFIAHEVAETLPVAATGTKDAIEAIGTLADYNGTVLETEVTEPSAEELEYTEETTDDEGVTTQTIRTRTWTATGTRPVYQGVDQTKLIPLLTKALQEALERIEALEAQLNP